MILLSWVFHTGEFRYSTFVTANSVHFDHKDAFMRLEDFIMIFLLVYVRLDELKDVRLFSCSEASFLFSLSLTQFFVFKDLFRCSTVNLPEF